jgi:hypothetical protein
MKRIIILITPLIFAFSFAQNYVNAHWRIYEIESQLLEQRLYDSANNALVDLFNAYDYRLTEGISLAAENMFCNLHKTWQEDSVLIDFYFRKFARSYPSDELLNLCKCADANTVKKIKENASVYNSIWLSSIDTALVNKIDALWKRDDEAIAAANINDAETMNRLYNINAAELGNLRLQYGKFPGVREIGVWGLKKISQIVHHSVDSILSWENTLIKNIQDGDFSPEPTINSIDRAIFATSVGWIDEKNKIVGIKHDKYGTNVFKVNDTLSLCVPVKDIDKTNILRKEVGLPPMDYEAKQAYKKSGIVYKYDVSEFTKFTGLELIDE